MSGELAGRGRPSPRDRIEMAKRAVLLTRTRTLARLRHPRQYVFIVSSGRSGSTLVQGLLNALPGVLVRGENSFYLMSLFRAQRRVRSFQGKYGAKSWTTSSAFYGIAEADADDFVRMTRTLMRNQLLARKNPFGITTIGFKEIRWEELEADEYAGFFRFFERIFPGAKYVLNDRDPERTADSGHWLNVDRQEALTALERGRQVRDFLRSTRPERTYDVSFEVITGKDAAAVDRQLSGLAEFVIGRSDAKLLADLRAVLAVGHGPFPFGKTRRGRAQTAAAKTATGADAAVAADRAADNAAVANTAAAANRADRTARPQGPAPLQDSADRGESVAAQETAESARSEPPHDAPG